MVIYFDPFWTTSISQFPGINFAKTDREPTTQHWNTRIIVQASGKKAESSKERFREIRFRTSGKCLLIYYSTLFTNYMCTCGIKKLTRQCTKHGVPPQPAPMEKLYNYYLVFELGNIFAHRVGNELITIRTVCAPYVHQIKRLGCRKKTMIFPRGPNAKTSQGRQKYVNVPVVSPTTFAREMINHFHLLF